MGLSKDGFTDKEIKNALHYATGSGTIDFRYELLENGIRAKDIHAEGTISLDKSRSVQRSARLTVFEKIDWIKNKIKVYMRLKVKNNWVEWPLGVFMPLSPTVNIDSVYLDTQYKIKRIDISNAKKINDLDVTWQAPINYGVQYEDLHNGYIDVKTVSSENLNAEISYTVDCYDETIILKEDCFVDRFFIAANTKYLNVVEEILISAGINQILVVNSVDTAIPADREFDAGETKLDVINTLLEEINFNPIYCDENGNFVISKYYEPSPEQVKYVYEANEYSIISERININQDYDDIPNVFVAKCTNPDLAQDFQAVYVNDNPASRLSTVYRGRKVVSNPAYRLDSVSSQSELDAYVRKKAFEASQVNEETEFITALMPIHGSGDIIAINHPGAQGIYEEISWEMELSSEGQMRHLVRRIMPLE